MDETFTPWIGEAREPLPPGPGGERSDSVSVRNGVGNLFLAFESLAGWRHVAVTALRTWCDRAHVVRDLVDGRYRDAAKGVLVMDPLNTHSAASRYEAFPSAEAQRIAARRVIHYTPKHGRWLNLAEIELSVLARDLPDRIGDRDALIRHVAAWEAGRNGAKVTADWQFTTADARIKLRKLDPTIEA